MIADDHCSTQRSSPVPHRLVAAVGRVQAEDRKATAERLQRVMKAERRGALEVSWDGVHFFSQKPGNMRLLGIPTGNKQTSETR